MSTAAKTYITAVVLIGTCVIISGLSHWESQDLVRFACYFALSIAASRLKVALPAITGALSVLFIFILFGIVELSLPEALLMGCFATLMQCLWQKRQQLRWHQVLFNVSSIAIAIATASNAYHSTVADQEPFRAGPQAAGHGHACSLR